MSAQQIPDCNPATVLMTADTVGGVWTYTLELVRGLTERGTEVVLATMGAPISPEQQADASSIHGLQVFESTYKLEWMQDPWADVEAAGEWLLEIERDCSPDIIHLNGYAHGALPWNAPVLIVGHSCVLSWWQAVKGEPAPSSWAQYWYRAASGLRSATMVAAPTQAMLDALNEHYGPLQSTRVLPNGRAPELFRRSEQKQPFIFAAGRLGDEAKNMHALGVAAKGLPWPVFVAGAEKDASGDQELPSDLNYCGRLEPRAVAAWMRAASIYCLPARYEPFGLSVLEAALSGCALVLGDIPSLRELWDGCACFVSPRNSDDLRTALFDLISDPARRAKLSAAAQIRAHQFTRERFINGYLAAYRDLLTSSELRPSLLA